LLNGVRIGQAGRELRSGDILQFGRIATAISFLGDVVLAREDDGDDALAVVPPGGRAFVQGLDTVPQRGVLLQPAMSLGEGQDVVLQTVTALAQAVELRDKYTGGHTQRVTNYALLLAERLALSTVECRILQVGVPLHDIGKIGVDDAVLRKAGALDR